MKASETGERKITKTLLHEIHHYYEWLHGVLLLYMKKFEQRAYNVENALYDFMKENNVELTPFSYVPE